MGRRKDFTTNQNEQRLVLLRAQNPQYKARQWVVEVTHSWMNRFRKLLVRYEKLDRTYKGLLMLSCAFIALRKAEVI
jgi:transposase